MNDEDLAIAIQENQESVKETSTVRCTYCNKTCIRTLVGYYPNGRDKKWVDDKGFEINGRCCPSCHKEKMALNLKLRRYNERK